MKEEKKKKNKQENMTVKIQVKRFRNRYGVNYKALVGGWLDKEEVVAETPQTLAARVSGVILHSFNPNQYEDKEVKLVITEKGERR